MCTCGIEGENNFLLESLAACHDANSKLVLYFTVNTAFINYLDQFDNLTELHEFPILKNMTTFEQTLPIFLNISKMAIFTKSTQDTERLYSPVQMQERNF